MLSTFLRILSVLLFTIILTGCSSSYKNEEFEHSRRITIEFSNAPIAQRHIDEFAKFVFEKSDVEEAITHVRNFSKKSGQYEVWQDSLEGLSTWVSSLREPGNYKFDTGFQPRTSLITWLLEEGRGEVCCGSGNQVWPRDKIRLAKPTEKQLKTYYQWATEPPKYKKYFMTPEKERIWPYLPLRENAFGE